MVQIKDYWIASPFEVSATHVVQQETHRNSIGKILYSIDCKMERNFYLGSNVSTLERNFYFGSNVPMLGSFLSIKTKLGLNNLSEQTDHINQSNYDKTVLLNWAQLLAKLVTLQEQGQNDQKQFSVQQNLPITLVDWLTWQATPDNGKYSLGQWTMKGNYQKYYMQIVKFYVHTIFALIKEVVNVIIFFQA